MYVKLVTYYIEDFDVLSFNLKFYLVFITFGIRENKIKYERRNMVVKGKMSAQ